MNNQRMQLFIVKYEIHYKSGKVFTRELQCYAITELGVKDRVYYLCKNYKTKRFVHIVSITPTGEYSPGASYGDNHTLGER
jgi:hypothetical protein